MARLTDLEMPKVDDTELDELELDLEDEEMDVEDVEDEELSPLVDVSDEDLIEEAKRRGLIEGDDEEELAEDEEELLGDADPIMPRNIGGGSY